MPGIAPSKTKSSARGLAPAQFDHLVLAADRVGAAVEHVRDGQAAGEVAVDVDIGRREHVLDPGHRAHRRAAFVDRVGGDVRVAVDDARRDELAGGVDDLGAGGNRDVRADCRHFAVAQDDRSVLDRPLVTVRIVPPLDGHHRGSVRVCAESTPKAASAECEQRDSKRKAASGHATLHLYGPTDVPALSSIASTSSGRASKGRPGRTMGPPATRCSVDGFGGGLEQVLDRTTRCCVPSSRDGSWASTGRGRCRRSPR